MVFSRSTIHDYGSRFNAVSVRCERRGGQALDAVLLGIGAFAGQRTGRALRLLLPAILVGHGADQVGEQRSLRLGNQMLQAGAALPGPPVRPRSDPGGRHSAASASRAGSRGRPASAASPRRPRNRWPPGSAPASWPPASGPSFAACPGRRRSRLEDFLQEATSRWARALGVGHAVEGVLQLAGRADADLVPVEEALVQDSDRPGRPARAWRPRGRRVDELLQHRARLRLPLGGLLGSREELGSKRCLLVVVAMGSDHSMNEMAKRGMRSERDGQCSRLGTRGSRFRGVVPRSFGGAVRGGVSASAPPRRSRLGEGLVDQARHLDALLDALIEHEIDDRA